MRSYINIVDDCTTCCLPSGYVEGTSAEAATSAGYVEQYIKCLKLPNATTHIKLEFQDLKLGDRSLKSLENGCTNMGDNSKVNHLTIQNGRGDVIPLFYCADSYIKESEAITRPITSSDNTLVFNLTAGRPPAEGNPWYDIHYTCKYL